MAERRESVDAKDFCTVYIPLAKEGKSAAEIAKALGFEGSAKDAQYVSLKASQLRKRFVEHAEAKAAKSKMKKDEREALVKAASEMLPKLKGQGRRKQDIDELASAVQGMLDKLNG